MSKKIYGVVGCGWLGLPMAKKWIQERKIVHGTTTSNDKIKNLETEGIIAHVLDSEKGNETNKWLSDLDYILLLLIVLLFSFSSSNVGGSMFNPCAA